ncbi:MAG: lactate racemase domain-containing protein [Planctomycetaceae bacterium]
MTREASDAGERSAADLLTASLAAPIGLPPLPQCVVPSDRVAIVVNPEVPHASEMIVAIHQQFLGPDSDPVDVTLLLPPECPAETSRRLVEQLPLHVRNQLAIHIHDPADEQQRRYLASSSGGERIYLSHYLTDADLIVTVGMIGFDARLGYSGTNSDLYPSFADTAAIQARSDRIAQAVRHPEWTPDQDRPDRQLVDEIGWLLGTQFAVQIIPDDRNSVAAVICGLPEEVMKSGRELLNRCWRVTVEDEAELAVVTLPASSARSVSQLGAALETASQIVGDGGQIAVIAELPEPDPGLLRLLSSNESPERMLKQLQRSATPELVPVAQIIRAVQRCRVYLRSNLPAAVAEELGMLSLADDAELQRLVDSAETVAVVPLANYGWADVVVNPGLQRL